jgi:putative copper export protein/methionine-rich copper-binding protein CopC
MRRRALYATSVLFGLSLLLPIALWAHAELTRSEPSAKSRLEKPPAEIRLWFSEAPEIRLTNVTLSDSAGRAVPTGAAVRGDSKLAIIVPITGTLSGGRYTVRWSTAAADGHPSSGSFSFTVLPSAAPVAVATEPVARPAVTPAPMTVDSAMVMPSPETVPYIIVRTITFIALLALIGVVVFRWMILPRLPNTDLRADVGSGLATAGLIAAATIVLASGARLSLQSTMMSQMSHVGLADLLRGTTWGQAWLLQCIGGVIAIVAFALARSGRATGWGLSTLMVMILALAPALSGHAVASPRLTALAIGDDTLHVIGAGGWLGSLLCLAAIGVPTVLRSTAANRLKDVADLVNAFSPVTLSFAVIVVVTGLVSAWLRLGALSPLWTSDYGRVLLVKLALLSGALATGAYNWLRVRPSLGTETSTATLRKSATAELIIGLAVVVVTAILVAVPTPLTQ